MGLQFYSGVGGELPNFALQYVSSFNKLLESFLTSSWFFVVFVFGWFGVSYSLGKESGWQNLAKHYSQSIQIDRNAKFNTGNGYIGKTRHNGILRVYGNKKGLFLKVFFLFKFGHKDLFIPWHDISSITLDKGLFSSKTPKLLKRLGESISKNSYLNIILNEFPEQRLTIQHFDELNNEIPLHLRPSDEGV